MLPLSQTATATQASYDAWNKTVWILRLEVKVLHNSLSSAGSLFQALGAVTEKAVANPSTCPWLEKVTIHRRTQGTACRVGSGRQ